MAKDLPSYEELVGYNHAVAGHEGILSDSSGELLIKPCTSAEIAFYENSLALYPKFAELMPKYLGTLALDRKDSRATVCDTSMTVSIENSSGNEATESSVPPSEQSTDGIGFTPKITLLENSITTDSTPNIHGHKIVTNKAIVLENASYGFRRPNIMDIKLGVRLWADDAPEEKRIRLDKATEDSTHKHLGFRIVGMRVWQGHASKEEGLDKEGYKIYDKDYGRYSVTKNNIHEAFRNFLFNTGTAISEELKKYVVQAFLTDVTRIQSILESHESRCFSSSLLFVFEGDGEALRAAIDESHQSSQSIDDFEDDEIDKPKICSVKFIDFAHAEWKPGCGPDENTLFGVRSVAKILKDISAE